MGALRDLRDFLFGNGPPPAVSPDELNRALMEMRDSAQLIKDGVDEQKRLAALLIDTAEQITLIVGRKAGGDAQKTGE